MAKTKGKKDNCIIYAILGATGAILLISLLKGFFFTDWGVLPWLGAIAIVAAALFGMWCKQGQDE